MNIPVAHVQGGEVTGSIDEKVRHAVTKLADLHFGKVCLDRFGQEPLIGLAGLAARGRAGGLFRCARWRWRIEQPLPSTTGKQSICTACRLRARR